MKVFCGKGSFMFRITLESILISEKNVFKRDFESLQWYEEILNEFCVQNSLYRSFGYRRDLLGSVCRRAYKKEGRSSV